MRLELPLFEPSDREPPEAALTEQRPPSILFGFDPAERVTAAEVLDNALVLWRRAEDGSVVRETRAVMPWVLLTDPAHAPSGSEVEILEGDGFRCLASLRRWDALRAARLDLSDRHVEHIAYASPVRAALTRAGVTLFRGMTMRDVRRMQVDIETAQLSPDGPEGRILLVAASDNHGLDEIVEGDERDLLERLIALIAERDPDVVEGHNIHGFDLPFIAARCRRHGIRPAFGRGGAELFAGYRRSFSVGGITRPLAPWHMPGRHIIDTFLAVQRFDWAKGSLSGYGLKHVARALGIAEEDRIELPREDMERLYRSDRERVIEYARQDVAETAKLAELVTATEFYQTQMVPDGYGSSAVSGVGEKINAIFIRAYLHAGRAIPRPLPPESYEGGFTDMRRAGVIHRIVKADVESLYPSIMLTSRIHPRTDTLGVFLPALAELTRRRLDAKSRAKSADRLEAQYWDGLQGSFKVLINSFYGYLGAGGFNFNDPAAAAEVTRIGRELVQRIANGIEDTGGSVVEIDTDGVYFVPPAGVDDEDAERAYIERIGTDLPQGIRLAFDGRYRTMVSVKTKNYVLLGYDGKRTFKGASLRSRADEPYGREFLARAADMMMAGRTDDLRSLYLDTVKALQQHRMPVEALARRERVTEKTFASAARQRLAQAAEGMSVGDYVMVYERADGRLGRAEEFTPGDESVRYYVDKLYKFACRLENAIGDRFHDLVPQPNDGEVTVTPKLGLFDDA